MVGVVPVIERLWCGWAAGRAMVFSGAGLYRGGMPTLLVLLFGKAPGNLGELCRDVSL